MAINYADGKIFYKNSGNAIVEFSTTGSFLPLSGGTLTGNLSIPNGSNSDLAIRFANDTNTGICRTNADELRIVTGGVARGTFSGAGIFLQQMYILVLIAHIEIMEEFGKQPQV